MFWALSRIYNTKHGNESKVWNSTGNVRCRTETIRVHFESETSTHNQAVASDAQHKVSYFVKEKNKEDELKDVIYEKVFHAL